MSSKGLVAAKNDSNNAHDHIRNKKRPDWQEAGRRNREQIHKKKSSRIAASLND
jgi:hypothetical protein